MELVDTSALILASRGTVVGAWLRDAVLANQAVICDQVALEYLRGARSQAEFDRFDAVLRAFPQVPIEPPVRHSVRRRPSSTVSFRRALPERLVIRRCAPLLVPRWYQRRGRIGSRRE